MREPSVKELAFSCPYCAAFTTQNWHNSYVKYIDGDKLPNLPTGEFVNQLQGSSTRDLPEETRSELIAWSKNMRAGSLFSDKKFVLENVLRVNNLFLSRCYNCKKWAIWVNENLVFPPKKFGTTPNQDLPTDILAIVEEARSILDLSPKGAAAMLRLALQMLCKHFGEKGQDINQDIANLVKKGLNPIIQQSLDIVRVVGNEAVHPGVLDLDDDKDIAVRLFDLINLIADQMITQPKHVKMLYEKLPESKRKAIEIRDSIKKP